MKCQNIKSTWSFLFLELHYSCIALNKSVALHNWSTRVQVSTTNVHKTAFVWNKWKIARLNVASIITYGSLSEVKKCVHHYMQNTLGYILQAKQKTTTAKNGQMWVLLWSATLVTLPHFLSSFLHKKVCVTWNQSPLAFVRPNNDISTQLCDQVVSKKLGTLGQCTWVCLGWEQGLWVYREQLSSAYTSSWEFPFTSFCRALDFWS